MSSFARSAGILTALALVGMSAPAHAEPQASAPATSLTLADAVGRAIAADPALHASRAAAAATDASEREARAAHFPIIVSSEQWMRTTQPVAAFGARLNAGALTAADLNVDRLNRPTALNGFSRQVEARQILFDAGRTGAAIAAAAAATRAVRARVTSEEDRVAAEVAAAYGAALRADMGVTAAAAAVDAAREDEARAGARRAAGTATDADVLSTEVRASNAAQALARAASERTIARAALNRLIGADLSASFDLTLPDTGTSRADLAALTSTAREQRADIREANERVAEAEARARAARSSRWPIVAAGAGYEWTGLDFGRRHAAWTVAAEATWTLSTGGAEFARASAARAGVDQARARRDALVRDAEFEVLAALERWTTAVAQARAGERAVASAREAHRIIGERYSSGLASVADVLAAAAASAAADAQDIANRVEVVSTWAALQRAQGLRP